MNVHMKARQPEPPSAPVPSKAVSASLDTSVTAAANNDAADDDAKQTNPLWMISVALAALFIFLTMLAGD